VQLAGVGVAPAPGRAAAGHALDQASGQAQAKLDDLGGDLALAAVGVCWLWHAFCYRIGELVSARLHRWMP